MNEPAATAWFCVKAKPRQEAVAARNLRALGEVDVVFPRLRRTRRGHDQNKLVVEPLFPGYLFLRFDAAELQTSVRGTRGVLHLVSQGGRAVEVAPKVIDDLRALGPEAILTLLDEAPQVGGKVRVIRGIFAGTEGEVLRLHEPQKRIAILLELLGSEKPVELSAEDVEKMGE
ncbi:transcription termination/antitermination protein NusG [Verrucomicrobiota bacterium]|nr:transcription termination/antitermination protein NusG [Verrucomicrobiota bacterium]